MQLRAVLLAIVIFWAPMLTAAQKIVPDDWFREAVGTWRIAMPEGDVELSLWESQLRTDRPSQSAFTIYHGIARTVDGTCAYTFEGSRTEPAPHYPHDQPDKDYHLRAYFSFNVGSPDWITAFRDPSDPEPRYSYRAPETVEAHAAWLRRVIGRERACKRSLPAFDFHRERADGPWLVSYSVLTGPTLEQVLSGEATMIRAAATPAMQGLIQNFKTANSSYPRERARWPAPGDMAAILNASVDAGPSPHRNSVCNQKRLAAAYRLAMETDYIKLEARLVDDKTVAITQQTRRRSSIELSRKDIVYYPRQPGIAWKDLSLIGLAGGDPEAVCRAADSLHVYLDRLNTGTLVAMEGEPAEENVLESFDGFYLVDRHGVGRIHISRHFGSQSYIGRVFGSTTHFLPGDRTHSVLEYPSSGTLAILPNLKDSVEGTIVSGAAFTVPDTIRFSYDETASDWLKVKAYVGKFTPRDKNLCVAWQTSPSSENCMRRVSEAERTNKEVFLINDLEKAITIFKNMSPDPATWVTTLAMDDCSDGPFCGPSGSRLLRAIYLGDSDSVREIEKLLIGQQTKVLQELNERLGGDGDIRITVLRHLIDEYMYDYKNRPRACFRPGAKRMVFERTTNEIKLVNGLNETVAEFGGDQLYGEYLINEEFVPICRKYCDVRESSVVASLIGQLFDGPNYSKEVRKMKTFAMNNDCSSPEVKQFEQNFLAMFMDVHPGEFDNGARFELSWY